MYTNMFIVCQYLSIVMKYHNLFSHFRYTTAKTLFLNYANGVFSELISRIDIWLVLEVFHSLVKVKLVFSGTRVMKS